MNRRNFLKSLFAVGALTAVDVNAAIEQALTETVNMSDVDFVAYINVSMRFYVDNPRSLGIITGISEPEY